MPRRSFVTDHDKLRRAADLLRFGSTNKIARRDFLKLGGALGLVLPGFGCEEDNDNVERAVVNGTFDGSVIVLGAGAAGMSVGHLLSQRGVSFQILEAAPGFGGRIKTVHDFVDFPIPLGGEWLHVNADELPRIVNDDSVDTSVQLAPYDPEDEVGTYSDGHLQLEPMGEYEDLKFVNGTWLTFFEQFIVPGIKQQMKFNTQISRINYTGDSVVLSDSSDATYTADAVVVTVPPQIIKDGDIRFVPPLPQRKQKAFDDAYIWGGMKVFLEFSERFYPVFLEIEGTNNDKGQKAFYDAAYGQNSKANVLGLLTVGEQSEPYQARTGDELRDFILGELDEIFDGAASKSYVQHVAQNWNEEPFIRQAYFADSADWRLPSVMRETVDGRVLFAGASYTDGEDWGSVHTAAQSARDAVAQLLS